MSRQLISEAKGFEILRQFNVPIPRYALATNITEAIAAAEAEDDTTAVVKH